MVIDGDRHDRLLQLWIVLECGLGGILHLVKLPLTGMLLGAYIVYYCYTHHRSTAGLTIGNLVFAVSTVAIAKIIITPHAGPGAFLALGYQAVICGAFFSVLSPRVAVIASSISIALCTAVHKILSWYIVLGHSLIDALQAWTTWLRDLHSALYLNEWQIAGLYLSFMMCWGILSGSLILRFGPSFTHAVYSAGIVPTQEYDISSNKRKYFRHVVGLTVAVVLAIVLDLPFLAIRIIIVMGIYWSVILPLWSKYMSRLKPSSTQASIISDALHLGPAYTSILKRWWRNPKS